MRASVRATARSRSIGGETPLLKIDLGTGRPWCRMSRNSGSGGAGGGPSRSKVEFDCTSGDPSRSAPAC
eukprot:3357883-Rhodomonas_salina.1